MKDQNIHMKFTLCSTATFCSVLSGLALATGSLHAGVPSGSTHRELQSDYRRFTVAETTLQYGRIEKAVTTFFSPTFVLYTPHGKTLNYSQFLNEMKAVTTENRAVKENAFHPGTITQQGNRLTETGVYVFSRTFLDVDQDFGAKGLPHSLTERTNYRSEWVRSGGRWHLQSMHLLGRTQIVDGKKHG